MSTKIRKQNHMSGDELRLYASVMPRWLQFVRQFGPNLGRPAFTQWLSKVGITVEGIHVKIGDERAVAMEAKICHSWLIHRGIVP